MMVHDVLVTGELLGLSFLLGALVVADIVTFTFHYPRPAIMFKTVDLPEPERLRRAAREWAAGNLVRGALLLVAFLSVLQAGFHVR